MERKSGSCANSAPLAERKSPSCARSWLVVERIFRTCDHAASHKSGIFFPAEEQIPHNSKKTFPVGRSAPHNSGKLFPAGGSAPHNSRISFPGPTPSLTCQRKPFRCVTHPLQAGSRNPSRELPGTRGTRQGHRSACRAWATDHPGPTRHMSGGRDAAAARFVPPAPSHGPKRRVSAGS